MISGIVSIVARKTPARRALIAGGCAAAVAMVFMVLAAGGHTLSYFLIASAIAGVSFGLLFLGALTLVNGNAPPARRGGTLSALYLIAYLAQGVFALALGVLARTWGLASAVEIGSAIIGLLGLVVIFIDKPATNGGLTT
jgi:MFS family permease